MALMDRLLVLGEDTALPATNTTEYSDKEIYFGVGKDAFGTALANPNVGQGTPLYFNFVMTQLASTGSSPTLTLNIVAGTATAPTTIVQIICSAVAAATLVAGYKFSVALKAFPAMPGFARLQVVAGTAGYTTGKYTAWFDTAPCADV